MNLTALFNCMSPGIGFGRLVRRMAGWQPLFSLPVCIDKPDGTRVLVVAPHPDDEAIGCGGTLHKHHLAGDRITAVFMTDGRKGSRHAGGTRGAALIHAREREAHAATARLGIGECIFLRNKDGALRCSGQTLEQITALLRSLRPDIVYAPSPLETHRDHRAACAITVRAVHALSRPVDVYLYEVWAPVPANCAVPIDIEEKLAVVRCYESQMGQDNSLAVATMNLARYRALTCFLGRERYAECFLRLKSNAVAELAESLGAVVEQRRGLKHRQSM